jgi:hypothetical protein
MSGYSLALRPRGQPLLQRGSLLYQLRQLGFDRFGIVASSACSPRQYSPQPCLKRNDCLACS